ncbi:MAG: endonuclease/exonuclease/phosphatase family protein [Pedobacter sp.]|nr:endonuclease/exonuclease/phosphatase family protein [Pedobacter sp.]
MAYNIHHANPPSKSKKGIIDIDAIARVIEKQHPDLVALQEVDVNTKRSGNINEAVLLAQKLKMNFYFGKAIDHDGGDYGVAILSRFPISNQRTYKLPKNADLKAEQRVLAIVTAEVRKNVFIRFASTHLDAQRAEENRILQAAEINKITEKETLPLILAGDLNAAPDTETIRIFDSMFMRTCSDCGFTIPVIKPNKTIDHIGFRIGNPFKVISHEVIPESYASDHLPILSVLELK